jgi:D-glycero-D-manno-heptose 1,7-bisphosphate phosphatase
VSGRPAVFLDRDGTIIEEEIYLSDPDGVQLVPGAVEAMRALRDAGYALVVVTNQSGIARGLYTIDEYHAVAARLNDILAGADLVVDRTEFCPHHPDITGPCPCRKPATGMYVRASDALDLDFARSYFVGDKITDVQPALELGGRGVLVRTGYGAELEDEAPPEVWVVDDLPAAATRILDGSPNEQGLP